MKRRFGSVWLGIVVLGLGGLGLNPSAYAGQLLVNGGFETGSLAGWTIASRPLGDGYGDPSDPVSGGFLINDGSGLTPLSGLTALGPSSGSFAALSDLTAQGTHALYQDFTVPEGTVSITLSFDMYVYDWYGGGGAIDPAGLDHTVDAPNQHARVDLLSAGADPFDTGLGVLGNFYLGVDPEAALGDPPIYRSYTIDLTGLALAGGTYRLRFAVVDNQFVLNQGVDNVSVSAVAVPEPSGWALLLGATPAVFLVRRRIRRA